MEQQAIPFGFWPSPISAASVAEGALRFGRVQAYEDAIYWSESRPAERGRAPIMRWTREGGISELLPAPYSARSRVHEYGGGEFLIADERLYFVNDADQDVYETSLASGKRAAIRRLTDLPRTRFADFTHDKLRKRLICVGETHDGPRRHLPENALWAIGTDASPADRARVALGGHDFYASPRLDPKGDRLAFLAWNLPDMPWDAAQLFVAQIEEDGSLSTPIAIAGGGESACFQPEWGPDGALYFVWDADGLGNLFRWREGEGIKKITSLDADLSLPLWNFHAASYTLLEGGKAYLSFIRTGETASALVDLGTGKLESHENGLTSTFTLSAGAGGVALSAMTDCEPLCLSLDPVKRGDGMEVIRRSSVVATASDYVPQPRRIVIPGQHGTIYGLLYPPKNPAARGPAGKLPPLIVNLHGGPTSAASRGLRQRVLFFTSRGFSWLDLDYSGSTGYGRAYRDRLKGKWGIADVDDTISAAQFAASAGLADPDAIFLTGGSAGGYTVLMATAAANLFRGAASHYGICDLVALQKTTHKFEQGYQSSLLGASLEANEGLYRERSAISHVERMATPLILFQGIDDNVVPKQQSLMIADALRAKGIRVEYHEFEGEGHGFRKAETIRASLERELAFYLSLI